MKGKIIAAGAAVVCAVASGYLIAGNDLSVDSAESASTASANDFREHLHASSVTTPDAVSEVTSVSSSVTDEATVAESSSPEATSESPAPQATNYGTDVALISESEEVLLAESQQSSQDLFDPITLAATSTDATTYGYGDVAQSGLMRTGSVMRRSSGLGGSGGSVAPTTDTAAFARESIQSSTDLTADELSELPAPTGELTAAVEESIATTPTSDYVPVVSTLSPELEHVLPGDETLTSEPTPVPVPATFALLGMGLLAAGFMRRSREG